MEKRFIKHTPKEKRFLLSAIEKKVIRKIAKVQIESCNDIITNNTERDFELEIIQEQIDPFAFRKELSNTIDLYEQLLTNPHMVFDMPSQEYPYIKHILFNFTRHSKYDAGRKSFFKKLWVLDIVPVNYN